MLKFTVSWEGKKYQSFPQNFFSLLMKKRAIQKGVDDGKLKKIFFWTVFVLFKKCLFFIDI